MDNSRALAIIEKARGSGALAFVGQGLGETVPLYKPDVTLLAVTPKDFHDIQGKLVARKEVCDRIGEAAGIDYIAENCHVDTEIRDDELGKRTVFIGFAQGRVRLPDGSWRQSTVEEYEFDPSLRAKLDAKSKPEGALRLEYMKAARQRASTGARLRVVRQLTGMPTSFPAQDIGQGKELVFGRVVQNTDYILSTPEGRMMAIAQATGATQSIYGPRREKSAPAIAEPEERVAAPESAAEPEDDWDDTPVPKLDPRAEKAMQELVEWLASGELSPKARASVQAIVDKGETDVIILEDYVKRARANAASVKAAES